MKCNAIERPWGEIQHVTVTVNDLSWCPDTSYPGHFGMTEVSRHFRTGAEVSYGRFGTRQSEYLHGRPVTLHIM